MNFIEEYNKHICKQLNKIIRKCKKLALAAGVEETEWADFASDDEECIVNIYNDIHNIIKNNNWTESLTFKCLLSTRAKKSTLKEALLEASCEDELYFDLSEEPMLEFLDLSLKTFKPRLS